MPKISWPQSITTKRLEIRPLKASDYSAWIAGYTGRFPKQHKYDGGPHDPKETPRAWFQELIKKHRAKAKADQSYILAIFEKKSGKHIGTVDIFTICRDWYQMGNIGYVIHNTEQGKGYGKEAAQAGIKLAFSKLGFKRIEAAINLDNKRSIALAKAIGLKRESVRKEFLFEHGKWTDHVVYVALNPSKAKKTYPLL